MKKYKASVFSLHSGTQLAWSSVLQTQYGIYADIYAICRSLTYDATSKSHPSLFPSIFPENSWNFHFQAISLDLFNLLKILFFFTPEANLSHWHASINFIFYIIIDFTSADSLKEREKYRELRGSAHKQRQQHKRTNIDTEYGTDDRTCETHMLMAVYSLSNKKYINESAYGRTYEGKTRESTKAL